MTPPDAALSRARAAYERSHVLSAARGVALAVGLAFAAVALHRTTEATWSVAALLAATLATLGWRGGAWRRGALAGVLVGLPVFVAPALLAMVSPGHCVECVATPTLACVAVCFGASAVAGTLVGHAATRDPAPRQYGAGALAGALFTGLLGCGTIGIGGAIGVAIGLVGGGVTGWWIATRPARA